MPRTEDWEISDDCATPAQALCEHGLEIFEELVAQFDADDVGPETMTKLHRALRREALVQADRAYGIIVVWLLAATNLDRVAIQAVQETEEKRLVNKGIRAVSLQLPSGIEVQVETTYLLHQKRDVREDQSVTVIEAVRAPGPIRPWKCWALILCANSVPSSKRRSCTPGLPATTFAPDGKWPKPLNMQ